MKPQAKRAATPRRNETASKAPSAPSQNRKRSAQRGKAKTASKARSAAKPRVGRQAGFARRYPARLGYLNALKTQDLAEPDDSGEQRIAALEFEITKHESRAVIGVVAVDPNVIANGMKVADEYLEVNENRIFTSEVDFVAARVDLDIDLAPGREGCDPLDADALARVATTPC